MTEDSTLERIWEVRRRIYAQCDNDLVKLVQYYMELQKTNPERLLATGHPKVTGGVEKLESVMYKVDL
jgi:hypothetical protein